MNHLLRIFSLVICISFVACAPKVYQSVKVVEKVESNPNVLVPAFQDLTQGKLYKAKVEVLKNYLSGLLVIKEVKGSKRVVFTSETGIKFFDFEFAPDTFIVHQVMEQFDNKHVLNTLQEDLGTIVFHQADQGVVELVNLPNETRLVYRKQLGENWLYYYYPQFSEGDKKLKSSIQRIERAGEKKQKVIHSFQNYEEGIPQLITIAHRDFKMNIELNYIKR